MNQTSHTIVNKHIKWGVSKQQIKPDPCRIAAPIKGAQRIATSHMPWNGNNFWVLTHTLWIGPCYWYLEWKVQISLLHSLLPEALLYRFWILSLASSSQPPHLNLLIGTDSDLVQNSLLPSVPSAPGLSLHLWPKAHFSVTSQLYSTVISHLMLFFSAEPYSQWNQ